MTNATFRIKTLGYHDKTWANDVLKLAIRELSNTTRVLSARQLEVFSLLKELEEYGWMWQSARLRNHINLAVRKGTFTARRADPSRRGGLS